VEERRGGVGMGGERRGGVGWEGRGEKEPATTAIGQGGRGGGPLTVRLFGRDSLSASFPRYLRKFSDGIHYPSVCALPPKILFISAAACLCFFSTLFLD